MAELRIDLATLFLSAAAFAAVACAGDSRTSNAGNRKDSSIVAIVPVGVATRPAGGGGPPLPYIARNACPGEGCELGKWIACRDLLGHREPSLTSPVVMRLHRDDTFVADSGEVIVERPGIIAFRDTVRIGAHDGPLTTENSTLMGPRDTIYLLDELGEGEWHAWIKGETREVYLLDEESKSAQGGAMRRVTEPLSAWWVKALAGSSNGWIAIDGGDVAGSAPHYEDSPPRCVPPEDSVASARRFVQGGARHWSATVARDAGPWAPPPRRHGAVDEA